MAGDVANAIETLLLILPSFFWVAISTTIPSFSTKRSKFKIYIIEFLTIVIPIILNVTILSKYVVGTVLVSLITCLLLLSLISMFHPQKSKTKSDTKSVTYRENYLTNARSTINLISVVAILAVDFNIFPSRFSKTHRTGFSLMDLGVGLYVYANGIVAPETRGKKDPIRSSIKNSAVLLIIGLLRLIFTKLTNYKVPEIEYGLHWNFFMTLAFTKIFTSCILNIFYINYIFVNAIVLSAAHETLLQVSLRDWVFLSDKRTDLISANKEGLVSSVGYVSLYLYSLYFRYSLNQAKKRNINASFVFIFWMAATLFITYFCAVNFEVSRRLANVGYVAWTLFVAILMTWLFYLWENFQKHLKTTNCNYAPYIYEAINYNGLVFFLCGNVLTGLINLTISTVQVGDFLALIIIFTYMLINCTIVFVLYDSGKKLVL